MNAIAQFQKTMAEHGLTPDVVHADGKIHRFDIHKKGNNHGWYMLHADNLPAGSFGDWGNGLNETWCSKARSKMTTDEYAENRRRIVADRAAQAASLQHQETATKARAMLSRSMPADPAHPYLVKKQVQPYGIRQLEGMLLVPVNVDKKLSILPIRVLTLLGLKPFA